MNLETVVPKLKVAFSRCARIDDRTVRCEKWFNDHPRAVYYFTTTQELPSAENLFEYQDELLGPSYYKADAALRWNHYLVFLTEDSKREDRTFQAARRFVEDNRDYARKYVLFESELDQFLDRSLVQEKASGPTDTIAVTWKNKLDSAGLSDIYRDVAKTSVVDAVINGKPDTPTRTRPRTLTSELALKLCNAIDVLEVSRFRQGAVGGRYVFGRANLLEGPNGSGKTSLLEVIEHFFCGATDRSQGEPEPLDGSIQFKASTEVFPLGATLSNQEYQARDMQWYAHLTNKGNELYRRFARFNFLNTDAAVHFSRDTT